MERSGGYKGQDMESLMKAGTSWVWQKLHSNEKDKVYIVAPLRWDPTLPVVNTPLHQIPLFANHKLYIDVTRNRWCNLKFIIVFEIK